MRSTGRERRIFFLSFSFYSAPRKAEMFGGIRVFMVQAGCRSRRGGISRQGDERGGLLVYDLSIAGNWRWNL